MCIVMLFVQFAVYKICTFDLPFFFIKFNLFVRLWRLKFKSYINVCAHSVAKPENLIEARGQRATTGKKNFFCKIQNESGRVN